MSSSEFLLAVAVAWLVIGTELSLVLTTRATEEGYDLLAIGTRGHGEAHLFGSAASELARTSKIQVLLVGDGKT